MQQALVKPFAIFLCTRWQASFTQGGPGHAFVIQCKCLCRSAFSVARLCTRLMSIRREGVCVSVLEITKSVPDRGVSISGASFVSCASLYCSSCCKPSRLVTKGALCCAFSGQCHVVILAFVNCSAPCMCRKSSPRPPRQFTVNGSAHALFTQLAERLPS